MIGGLTSAKAHIGTQRPPGALKRSFPRMNAGASTGFPGIACVPPGYLGIGTDIGGKDVVALELASEVSPSIAVYLALFFSSSVLPLRANFGIIYEKCDVF
jgi:hypothetical protein